MTSKDVIRDLSGLDWKQIGPIYRTTVENSDEFSDFFNFFSTYRGLSLDTTKTEPSGLTYVYTDGEVEVTLICNFDDNIYVMTVGDR